MDVIVGAHSNGLVDTVQVYLEFDPDKLRVESIAPGTHLEYLLRSTWEASPGRVVYAAGTLGTAAESSFTLCTITFRATEQSGDTTTRVGFAGRANLHRTKVIRRGLDVTGRLHPLEVAIQ